MNPGIRNGLVAAAAVVLLATCVSLDETDSDIAAVKGGDVVIGGNFPAVAKLDIILPPDPNPRDPIICSGVLISANQVLTSAQCTEDVVLNPSMVTVGFGGDGNSPGGITPISIEPHRYYDPNNTGAFQVSIVVIPDQVIAFADVNDAALADTIVGTMITLVGYGETDDGAGLFSRTGQTAPINSVSREFITAGTAGTVETCDGDGGGPVFSGPNLVAAVTQFQSSCSATTQRTRTDRHTADFIHRFVDQFNGPCRVDGTCETANCRTPDPDCRGVGPDPDNGCEWGNDCVEDCPTRDWDCPLGSFAGEVCAISGECEENGRCLAADDDDTFLYCTKACEAGSTDQCPENMECRDNGDGPECSYLIPSSGSQGFECTNNNQCRSGICEDRICVNECDLANPMCPANPTGGADYICGPSKVSPGTNVCLGENLSGGGGFCNASGDGAGGGALVLLGLALLGWRRRR